MLSKGFTGGVSEFFVSGFVLRKVGDDAFSKLWLVMGTLVATKPVLSNLNSLATKSSLCFVSFDTRRDHRCRLPDLGQRRPNVTMFPGNFCQSWCPYMFSVRISFAGQERLSSLVRGHRKERPLDCRYQ